MRCVTLPTRALVRRSLFLQQRWTTAYTGEPGDGSLGLDHLAYIPLETVLPKTLEQVIVSPFRPEDVEYGCRLMNLVIRDGKSWPFEQEFTSSTSFRGYFLSHTAMTVRYARPTQHTSIEYGELLGIFYIKPNFPGRCSHICNGGFITSPHARHQGVATLMGHVFLQVARDLGYRSSYFNLVFASNTASVKLWESLNFQRVAVLPEAARLEGAPGLDTAYGYRYDLTQLPEDYLQQKLQIE